LNAEYGIDEIDPKQSLIFGGQKLSFGEGRLNDADAPIADEFAPMLWLH
jgi:hypothetical protein